MKRGESRQLAEAGAESVRRESLIELRDVLVFSGVSLAAYGAWLIYQPAAFVVAGVALFVLGKFPGLGAIRADGNSKAT